MKLTLCYCAAVVERSRRHRTWLAASLLCAYSSASCYRVHRKRCSRQHTRCIHSICSRSRNTLEQLDLREPFPRHASERSLACFIYISRHRMEDLGKRAWGTSHPCAALAPSRPSLPYTARARTPTRVALRRLLARIQCLSLHRSLHRTDGIFSICSCSPAAGCGYSMSARPRISEEEEAGGRRI
ncbi:uncharacterized protein LAESUDRAFT_49257 [Laetiporus sulphureus 93-53]|uniref:Uncharacterized protein n=1 Tax=Laetiporus sulphureus 93-53 TaxID=1314785 RepID=A0A165FAL1_9APHY|nr:uncharacterized protein LAESUDRAFT_49257 [Laetiporus sulphureus 93-53]KZT08678.1 hypothetical protein LAESUDRAFT_49257 [Laetiporus sulphureus 93-53]